MTNKKFPCEVGSDFYMLTLPYRKTKYVELTKAGQLFRCYSTLKYRRVKEWHSVPIEIGFGDRLTWLRSRGYIILPSRPPKYLMVGDNL